VDSLQKKIDKPAITAIPTNRDMVSQFVKDIQNAKVEPIQPKFVDWQKDMTIAQTKSKLPLYYVKNNTNGLFEMNFLYKFGNCADNRYDVASDYLDFLGTDKMTAAQIKQKFYELGCDFQVSVGSEETRVYLYGLSENMQPALTLLENLFKNLKVDQDAYNQLVSRIEKQRTDAKKSQQQNFNRLFQYGLFGARNSSQDMMTAEQLKNTNPQVLVDLLKNLNTLEHSVLYYGPMNEKELGTLLAKVHQTPKKLTAVPVNKPYEYQVANQNEVWIAPYDAKNIYMRMYHNEQREWNADEAAIQAVFNEYFGGGMNGVVFQEMREARGLAYNASARYTAPSRKGDKEFYFTHIITQNDKMMDCVREFHNILNNMPASENAFNIAKEGLTKQLASLRTTKMGIINSYINAQRRGIDYVLNEKIYNDLKKVTLQDMVNFEKQTMANKAYRYLILGDEKELDMKALEKIGPVKRLTTEEIFGY
jgi:predicted Zn-dependent peptidase